MHWTGWVTAICLGTWLPLAWGAGKAPSEECRASLKGRRITLVVPYSAGGGFDNYARAFAPALERSSGARVSVSNVPGAGGLIGMKAVAEGGSEPIRLGFFEGSNLVQISESTQEVRLEQFTFMGTITTERQAWAARAGFALDPAAGKPLVAAVSDPHAFVIEVAMAGAALGLPVRLTPGYKGSGERFAAALRGEVDITSNSTGTVLKAVRGGDLKPVLVIADAPDKAFPGVPHLAGKGGLVDRLHDKSPPAVRADAMRLAQTVADMATSFRAVVASSRLKPATLACVGDLVEEILFSDEFARAAGSVDRPVAPRDREATRALVERLVRDTRANETLIRRLAAEAIR